MRDPQAMSGIQAYPPPPGPCTCGHSWGSHRIARSGRRTSCMVHGRRVPCGCKRYREASGATD